MTYRVAEGHDIALVSLTVLAPQPRSEGVRATRVDHMADGTIVKQGLYLEFTWSSHRNTTAYQTLLALIGLDSATSAAVTIYARNDMYQWIRYNGVAVRPEPGQGVSYRSFPRNITILIRELEALA